MNLSTSYVVSAVLSTLLTLSLQAQVKPTTKLSASEGSGEGRNGPDLGGVANPKGADQLIKRDVVFKNSCNCLIDLYSDMYQQIKGSDFKTDYPKEQLKCSYREVNNIVAGTNNPSLLDNMAQWRLMYVSNFGTKNNSLMSRYVDLNYQFVPGNKTTVSFPGVDEVFIIDELPLIGYKAKIDSVNVDSLGKVKNISYSVSDLILNFGDDNTTTLDSSRDYIRLKNSNQEVEVIGTEAVYGYEKAFDTDVIVNLKKYRRCLLNVK